MKIVIAVITCFIIDEVEENLNIIGNNPLNNIIHNKYQKIKIIQKSMNEQIPSQSRTNPYLIKIVLVSNRVYNFEVDKNMKLSDFKLLISQEINIPINKIRVMGSGKQLFDDQLLCQYVKQCGLVVHLVGKQAMLNSQHPSEQLHPPSTEIFPNLSTTLNQSQPPQIQNTNHAIIIRQEINIPFENLNNNLSLPLSNLFNLGNQGGFAPISMSFLDPNSNTFGNIQIRVSQSNQQIRPQQLQQQQQNSQLGISYSQIHQLNQQLNNLNSNPNIIRNNEDTLTPEGVIKYLRHLYDQSTRSMLQLNKLVNLTENSSISNLQSFIPVFQSLNTNNNTAINYLKELSSHNNQQEQPPQQNNPTTQQIPQVLSINQNNVQNITLFQITIQPEEFEVQEEPQQIQNQYQIIQNQIEILDNNTNEDNLFIIFEGINALLTMSLKQIISHSGNKYNGIFIDLFGKITGQNMIQIFIIKNVISLKEQQNELKVNLKKYLNEKGQKYLIEQMSTDISNMFIPKSQHSMIANLKQCRQKCMVYLKRKVKKLIDLLKSNNTIEFDVQLLDIIKQSLYEIISIINNYTTNKNTNIAFQIIKTQILGMIEPVLTKNANIFYQFIQKDLLRIYHQQKNKKDKKRIISDNIDNQEELIEIIEEGGQRDSQQLKNMAHSKYYYKQQ